MALVIEDGTLVAGANSFATRAELIAYAAARGKTLANDATTDGRALQAMDWLWAQDNFCGDLVSSEQTTPFPRKGVVEGDEEEDYVYSIPGAVKQVQLFLAFEASQGKTLISAIDASPLLKRRKVGPMEREFFGPNEGGGSVLYSSPTVTAMLAGVTCSGFTLKTVRA